jgi:hypothetical protein
MIFYDKFYDFPYCAMTPPLLHLRSRAFGAGAQYGALDLDV